MRFIAFFIAACSFLPVLARTVQVPVELKNSSNSAGRRVFFVALPLPTGAVQKVENIQLTNADGSECAAQFTVVNRWQDGSLKLVRICGLAPMRAKEKRKIFVEYGDKVLQAVYPGILIARSNDRMLVEAGVLSAEFDLKKLSLPSVIRLNKVQCGGFAPFPAEKESTVYHVVESDALHTVIQMTNCRIHFFYNEPWIAVEWLKKPIPQVTFSRNSKIRSSGVKGNWQVFRFDGKSANLPPQAVGVIPEWYYEKCGILVAGDRRSAVLNRFEEELISRMRSRMSAVPVELLLQGFFRTGDVSFIHAALKRQNGILSRSEAAWLQGFSAGHLRWQTECDFASNTAKSVMSTEQLCRELSAMSVDTQEKMEKFLQYGEILAGRFDHTSGRWFTQVDDSGKARRRKLLSVADNIRCSAVMFEMAKITQEKRYGEVGIKALNRILSDGIVDEVITTEAVFRLLDRAREYVKRHPGAERNIDAAGFLFNGEKKSRGAIGFHLYPGEKMKVEPAGNGEIEVECCRNGEDGNLVVKEPNSRKIAFRQDGQSKLYHIRVPERGCFLSSPGEKMSCIRISDMSQCRIKLPLSEKMRIFSIEAPEIFTVDVPEKQKELTFLLRAMGKGERAKLTAISPEGKRYYAEDVNCDGSGVVFAGIKSISDAPSGKWTIILSSSGSEVALGVKNFQTILEK